MSLPNPKDLLPEIVRRLVAEARPKRIILFGSHGRGDAGPDSDLDILVIQDQIQSRYQESVKLRQILKGIPAPMDILVVSEAEYEARSQVRSTVYYWARTEGILLYGPAG